MSQNGSPTVRQISPALRRRPVWSTKVILPAGTAVTGTTFMVVFWLSSAAMIIEWQIALLSLTAPRGAHDRWLVSRRAS